MKFIGDLGDSGPVNSLILIQTLQQDSVMAIWTDKTTPTKEASIMTPPAEPALKREPDYTADITPQAPRRTVARETKESVIAAEITITGKIDGVGHVRVAGKFEGDVNIQGDLTIEPGAKLTGGIRADSVAIAGEIEGNIDNASKVELLSSGIINGDIKAGTLTVAAGSRMRGRVEFGWGEEHATTSSLTLGTRQAS
jgi:cytoskeletal protein CcmA (bactofilin family)